MSGELDRRVVLITGAAGGLGSALCEILSRDEALLIASDVDADAARDVARRFQAAGRNVVAQRLDVTSVDEAAAVVQRVIGEFGRLDVLVNNAGIDVTRPIEQLAVADFDRILAVNLRGAFVLSKLVLPHFKQRGCGHIVNIVSTAARRTWPNAAAYHASKWGLLGLSHALHAEARPWGVKVTAVIAGGMRTDFLLKRFPDLDTNLLQDPANVAEAVRFVLSQPAETVVPEIMVLPMRETSWP